MITYNYINNHISVNKKFILAGLQNLHKPLGWDSNFSRLWRFKNYINPLVYLNKFLAAALQNLITASICQGSWYKFI